MHDSSLLTAQDLELLRLQARQLDFGRLSGSSTVHGEQRSPQRGMGMELEELRSYQLGDDVRHIAWRASARSNMPVTKVFRAERQQRILLLIEQHGGMLFATEGELKATCAARLTALLAFAAQQQRAEVGAVIMGEEPHHFGYSSRLDQILALIGAVAATPAPQSRPAPAGVLAQGQRLSRRDDTLFIISDFSHWDDALAPALQQLGESRQVTALQIIDRGEQQLPAIGRMRLRSPYSGAEVVIDSGNAALRQRYENAMSEKQQQLTALLQRCGVRHLRLHTDDALHLRLAEAL